MFLKKSMVKSHEKFVTASYWELIKRGTVINLTGAVVCYGFWAIAMMAYKKINAKATEEIENTVIENEN